MTSPCASRGEFWLIPGCAIGFGERVSQDRAFAKALGDRPVFAEVDLVAPWSYVRDESFSHNLIACELETDRALQV